MRDEAEMLKRATEQGNTDGNGPEDVAPVEDLDFEGVDNYGDGQ